MKKTERKVKKQKETRNTTWLTWKILRNFVFTLLAGMLILGVTWLLSIIGEALIGGIQSFWKSCGVVFILSGFFWVTLFTIVTVVTEKREKRKESAEDEDEDDDDAEDEDEEK